MRMIWKKVKLVSLAMVFTARLTIYLMQTSSQKCAILLVCIKINYHGGCKQLILSDGIRFVVVFKCHCFKAQDSQILLILRYLEMPREFG